MGEGHVSTIEDIRTMYRTAIGWLHASQVFNGRSRRRTDELRDFRADAAPCMASGIEKASYNAPFNIAHGGKQDG